MELYHLRLVCRDNGGGYQMPGKAVVGALYQVQALLQIDHRVQEPPVTGGRTLTGGEELEVVPPLFRGHPGGDILRCGPGLTIVRAAHHVEEIDVLCPVVVHEIIEEEYGAADRVGNQRRIRGRLPVGEIRDLPYRAPGPSAVRAAAHDDVDVPAPFEVSAGRHPLVYRRYQTAVRGCGYGRYAIAGHRPRRVSPVYSKQYLPHYSPQTIRTALNIRKPYGIYCAHTILNICTGIRTQTSRSPYSQHGRHHFPFYHN